MKKKLTGSTTAAIAMFLMSGALASVLGVRQIERYNTHDVMGLNGDWPAGVIVRQTMLKSVRVSKDVAGIPEPRQVVGLQLVAEKKDGEVLQPGELRRPERSWLAQQVPQGKVLYTMAPHAGAIPYTQLRNGDSFDVIATGRAGVRTVAKDVRLIGVTGQNRGAAVGKNGDQDAGILGLARPRSQSGAGTKLPPSMVVAVAPEYVYPLAHLSASDNVSIVLHGEAQTLQQRAHLEPKPTHRQVEVVSGLHRKIISVAIRQR